MYTDRLHKAIMFAAVAHKAQKRKEDDIASLIEGGKGLKQIVFADKFANIISLLDDYRIPGDSVYERFNAGKAGQAWFYRELMMVFKHNADVLSEGLVRDYARVYEEVFGGCV